MRTQGVCEPLYVCACMFCVRVQVYICAPVCMCVCMPLSVRLCVCAPVCSWEKRHTAYQWTVDERNVCFKVFVCLSVSVSPCSILSL